MEGFAFVSLLQENSSAAFFLLSFPFLYFFPLVSIFFFYELGRRVGQPMATLGSL